MTPLAGFCSMAPRALLAELALSWDGGVAWTALGGVAVAQWLRDGAVADVVVLAEAALAGLEADGLIQPGSRVLVAVSSMAVAVREETALPDLSDVPALQRALRAAGRVGYSTGPSGDHLLRLVRAWGLDAASLVQAPPGVPVGRLLADGAVDLAVQQRSELMGLPGIVIAGPLPPGAASDTVFAAAVASASTQKAEAARLVVFLAAAHREIKTRHGMRPARTTMEEPC